MPTYDYRCESCGHTWEMFQRITEDAVKKCPECKKNKACRLFGTGAAVVFKGSGFYQTDYRSDSYKSGEKAANKAQDKKQDKKSDGKSDRSSKSSSSTKQDSAPAKSSSDSKPTKSNKKEK